MSTMLHQHRKSSRTLSGLLVLIACTAGPAAALEEADFGFETTASLYNVCTSAPADRGHGAAQAACNAFIEAAVQYHDAVTTRDGLGRVICYPQGTTLSEGRAAFVTWAEAHRANAEWMAEMPVVGLVRALGEAFPCD